MSGDYVPFTVNLVPKAVAALEDAARLSRFSKTDTLNRAIQAWALIELVRAHGGKVYVRETPNGVLSEIRFEDDLRQ